MTRPPATYPQFSFAYMVTLAFGGVLSEIIYDERALATVLGLYVAGMFFQAWLFGTRYFTDPSRATKKEAIDEQVIFAGAPLETEASAEREKEVLEGVLTFGTQVKLRIATVVMLAVLGTLVAKGYLSIHVTLCLHVLAALMMVPAMTPNHFILPLVTNLAAVAYSLSNAGHADWRLYASYVIVFLYALVTYENTQRELSQGESRKPALGPIQRRALSSAFQLGVGYLMLFAIVEQLVPEPAIDSPRKQGIQTQVKKIKDILARGRAESTRSGADNQDTPSSTSSDKPMEEGQSEERPSGSPESGASARPEAEASTPGDHPSPEARASAGPDGPKPEPQGQASSVPDALARAAQELMRSGKLDDALRSSKVELKPELKKLLTPERLKAAQNLLEQMAQNEAQRGAQSDGSLEGTPIPQPAGKLGGKIPSFELGLDGRSIPVKVPGRGPPKLPKNIDRKAVLKAVETVMRQSIADVAREPERQGGSSGASTTGSTGQGSGAGERVNKEDTSFQDKLMGRTGETGGDAKLTAKLNPTPAEKPPPKFPELPKSLESLLTPLLVLLVAVAIYLFRRKLKKQGDPTQIRRAQLSREQRMEILRELKQLSRRKMSPREEVIARYAVFCRIMEMARTPREKYVPPTDFHRRVRLLHPPIQEHSKKITETFCDTLYGDLPPAGEKVMGCRGAVKEVFQYFAV